VVNNKVVVRFADGRVLKGNTTDFLPTRDRFHLATIGSAPGAKPVPILVSDLKALIFVKDFAGNPSHEERKEFSSERSAAGRRIRVLFKDGEMLVGTTNGYQPGRPGFFLVPVDPESNMERCFVVAAATTKIAFV